MSKKIDSIAVIALTALIYAPGTTLGSVLRLGVLFCVFMAINLSKGLRIHPKAFLLAMCMVMSPILPAACVYVLEGYINSAVVRHEMIRMFYCALMLLTVYRISVPFKTIYFCAILALIPNFTIQIMQYIGYQPVFTFIRANYLTSTAEWTHLDLATYSGLEFRSGSIFLNPNVYMTIPLLALCIFLQQDKMKSSLINLGFIFAAALSGFLTGSRTALVLMMLILGVYFIKYARARNKAVILAAAMVFFVVFGAYLLQNSRAFQFSVEDEGPIGSLGVKLNSYLWYFQRTQSIPIYWLTGSIGSSLSGGMDAEWGHIYAWYGVFGLMWYIAYYVQMFRQNRNLPYYSRIAVVCCMLVSFTSSLLLCMPVYSFGGTVTLAHISTEEPEKRRKCG